MGEKSDRLIENTEYRIQNTEYRIQNGEWRNGEMVKEEVYKCSWR